MNSEEERDRYWELYRRQKNKVKGLVREAKVRYEVRIAQEIKRSRNGKKIWKMINKLKGEGRVEKKKRLYREDGFEVLEGEEGEDMMECWREIYLSLIHI